MEFLITPFKVILSTILLYSSILEVSAQGLSKTRDPVLSLDFFNKKRTHCIIKKDYLYLSNKKKKQLSKKLKRDLTQSIYKRYKLSCFKSKGDEYIYLVNKLVRTHYMAMLVHVKDSKLIDYEIVKFLEPPEYKPRAHWLNKLKDISIRKKIEIDGISGATLTTQTVRSILEEIQVIEID